MVSLREGTCDTTKGSTVTRTGNRLSIGHLLLWTTTTAAVVAVFRLESAFSVELIAVLTPQERFRQLASCGLLFAVPPIFGAAIGYVVIVGYRWLANGPPLLTQAGHWLLFALGLTVSAPMLIAAIGHMVRPPSPSSIGETLEIFLLFRWI